MPNGLVPARLADQVSLDDFRLVAAIAEAKGLTGAAERLGINHSTVFRRLGQLEAALGCRLFERHRSGYALTPAGEEMVGAALRMEEGAAAFLRKVEGKALLPAGEVRITTNDALLMGMLTPIFAAFLKQHPQVRLDVVQGNAPFNLSRRDADIAVRATESPPDTLVGRRIGSIAWAIYGRKVDFPDPPPTCDPLALAGQNWVTPGEELASVKAARFVREHIALGQVVYKVNTVPGLVAAVAAGIGIAPLPCMSAEREPSLIRLSEPNADISGTLWLLTHPELRQSPRVRVVMDFLGAELARHRATMEGGLRPDEPAHAPAGA